MAELALFHHHLTAADIAVLVAEHIRHLQLYAVHGGLSRVHLFIEILIKVRQDLTPLGSAVFDLVQLGLHVVCEFQIHNVGKVLLHHACHHLAQRRGAQVLALLDHIVVGGDGGYGGRVGGGAAYALLLHGADQRGLGIAGGGLSKLLVRQHFFQAQPFSLAERGQGIGKLGALLVLGFFIHGGITGEFQL